jgi:hypothetical protein
LAGQDSELLLGCQGLLVFFSTAHIRKWNLSICHANEKEQAGTYGLAGALYVDEEE